MKVLLIVMMISWTFVGCSDGGTAAKEQKLVRKLKYISTSIISDQVIFATTKPHWREDTIRIIQEVFHNSQAKIFILENLGTEIETEYFL